MDSLDKWNQSSDPYFNSRDVLAFDLDDTLTLRGELPSKIIQLLEQCQKKNLICILVTGRSAGWADALIKLLPFDAVVAENGAVLRFFPKGRSNRLPTEKATELFWSSNGYGQNVPAEIRSKHELATFEILKAVPGVQVASDQPYRLYDLAIDFCEEVTPPLGLKEAELIKKKFNELGAVAKISSIHVNGWWGEFSKIEGLSYLLEKVYNRTLSKHVVYTGDSPNDAPLFASDALSVGVANVHDFKNLDFDRPQYVCSKHSGDGAAELLEKVLNR